MAGTGEERPEGAARAQRLDKWLWFARVMKSRTSAAQLIEDGKVRVNRTRATKPSQTVRAGDVLTIALRGGVRILKVLAPGERRGPPAEARLLYEVVGTPDAAKTSHSAAAVAKREAGAARPTKRDRRLIEQFTGQKLKAARS